jgi:hypothetical protein
MPPCGVCAVMSRRVGVGSGSDAFALLKPNVGLICEHLTDQAAAADRPAVVWRVLNDGRRAAGLMIATGLRPRSQHPPRSGCQSLHQNLDGLDLLVEDPQTERPHEVATVGSTSFAHRCVRYWRHAG